MTSRRSFLSALPGVALGLLALPRRAAAGRIAFIEHPDPRPGIDGSNVLTTEQLSAFPESVLEIYDMVREIAPVADGLGCACGCAALPTYRSLLTCFEPGGMAMGCPICQGEARLAYRRHQEGQTLDQIRRAIDARWG